MNSVIGKIIYEGENCVPLIHLSQKIEIERCVNTLAKEDFKSSNLVRYLQKFGTTIKQEVWETYPNDIPKPAKTREFFCHRNTILYMYDLLNHFKGDDSKLKYITGMYRLFAKNESVPSEMKCIIGSHSFLVYEDKILDCTILNHPPQFYEVDEYFGVIYSPKDAIKRIKKSVMQLLLQNASPLYIFEKES